MTPDIAYSQLLPMLLVFGAGIVSTLVEAFVPARARYVTQTALTLGGLGAALAGVVGLAGTRSLTAEGSVAVDGVALFLQGATVVVALASVVLMGERTGDRARVLAGFAPQSAVAPGGDAERDATRAGVMQTEVFPLVLFATGGLMLFPASNDLLTLFITLEVLSLPLYVLCAMARRRRLLSQEAALKYFLLGAFSSAIFLYGVALTYGFAGTVDIDGIARVVADDDGGTLALIGIAMMSVGLLFKVGAVPFHTWTPDVYQGAPTAVTGFMAAAVKIAAFGAMLRLFYVAFEGLADDWRPVLWVVAALSMLAGTVIGVSQRDVKRMLAYSSVAHAGFLLTGIVALNDSGASGLLVYLAVYGVGTVGAFAVVSLVRDGEGAELTDLDSWAGLGRRSPLVAGAFAWLLLALAGIPLTGGFVAKFAVFSAAAEGGAIGLVVIGVLTSAIAAFFYVRVIVVMFFHDPPDPDDGPGAHGIAAPPTAEPGRVAQRPLAFGVVGLSAAVTLVIGVFPQPLLALAEAAAVFAG